MRDFIYRMLPFCPKIFLYLANIIRYKYHYNSSLVAANAFVFNTKLGYKTKVSWGNFLFNCTVGDFSYINSTVNSVFWAWIDWSLTNVEIGKFCSIWPKLEIIGGAHKQNITTFPMLGAFEGKDIEWDYKWHKTVIGNDVWIGTNVTIVGNNIIWDGAIIWAGAVVVGDIEPYSIVWWVPAKLIRYRYSSEQIAKLLSIRWWNWSISEIQKHKAYFTNNNIEEFLTQFGEKISWAK